MNIAKAGLGELLLCLLFPPRCLLCGDRTAPGEVFCEDCALQAPESPVERRFPVPGEGERELRVLSPLFYKGGVKETVRQFKFQGKRGLAKPLGRLMAGAAAGEGPFDGVAWVPMGREGKRKRGYDQSQLLARSVARSLRIPCLPLLQKVRETQTQHELSRREREKNVKNAYQSDDRARGRSLLLVDDIVTTGATLTACAQALYSAGALRVAGLCAANTPEADESPM